MKGVESLPGQGVGVKKMYGVKMLIENVIPGHSVHATCLRDHVRLLDVEHGLPRGLREVAREGRFVSSSGEDAVQDVPEGVVLFDFSVADVISGNQ